MNGRHTEFFGPDLGRGPFSSQRIETSALQIAVALAQIRAPLTRSDDDLRAHADFIRELADRLAPDWAAQVTLSVGAEINNSVTTAIVVPTGAYSLLDCWLSDEPGGGITATAPTSITFNTGVVLETIVANKRFLVVTPTTGIIDVTITCAAARSWYWAVSRYARVYYSARLAFA